MKDSIPSPVEDAELERLMDALVKAAGWPASVAQRGDVSAIRRDILAYVSADTRRLDWLDGNDLSLRHFQLGSIRQAIDAAMRESPQDV